MCLNGAVGNVYKCLRLLITVHNSIDTIDKGCELHYYYIMAVVFVLQSSSGYCLHSNTLIDPLLILSHGWSFLQTTGADSVVVKVHYTYTIALSVPLETPYRELQERIAQKLGQPAELIRLR